MLSGFIRALPLPIESVVLFLQCAGVHQVCFLKGDDVWNQSFPSPRYVALQGL